MKKLTLLLAICWGFTLSAVDMKDPIQDIKTSYQSIKASFNPDKDQFFSILKNEKVNSYLKGSPMAFWIEAINTSNNKNKVQRSRRTKSYITEYNVLDTVTIDVTDLELPVGKAMIAMDYDDDALCQHIEALLCDNDTSICLGGVDLSYNASKLIDTMTVKIITEDGSLSTAACIVACYNSNDRIVKLTINLNYSDLGLDFQDAMIFEIGYDEADQLAELKVYADADFTSYVTYEMMSFDDSLTFEEEKICLAEVAISRNANQDIICLYEKHNNIMDTVWQGNKYEVTYQDTLITECKISELGLNGWCDSTASITSYQYNENQNIVKYSEIYYDNDCHRRYCEPMIEFFYNEKQQVDSIYEYDIADYDTYDPQVNNYLYGKFVYEYDNDKLVASNRYYPNGNTCSWRRGTRREYEYDMNDMICAYRTLGTLDFTDTIYKYDEYFTFDYNEDNRLSTYTIYNGQTYEHRDSNHQVDSVHQQWREHRKYSLTWSGEYLDAFQFESYYDSCWIKRERLEMTHDVSNNFTGATYYSDYEEETGWLELASLKIDYNTDIELNDAELPQVISSVSNYLLASIGLDKDLSSKSKPASKIPLSTQLLGYANVDDALNGLVSNLQVNNAPTCISAQLKQDDACLNGSINFHYKSISKSTASVDEHNMSLNQTLSLYPNPASSSVSITGANDGDRIKIYDVNGRQVLQQSIINTNSIDISSLLKGLYMYSVSSGSLEHKGKLMVE